MEIRDWIMIISAIIVSLGWFVTGYLNRVKDIAQKRLEYRLITLEAFLPIFFNIQTNGNKVFKQNNFLEQLADVRSKFQLYGFKDEIVLMEQFINAIESGNISEFQSKINELVQLVRLRLRKELKIKD